VSPLERIMQTIFIPSKYPLYATTNNATGKSHLEKQQAKHSKHTSHIENSLPQKFEPKEIIVKSQIPFNDFVFNATIIPVTNAIKEKIEKKIILIFPTFRRSLKIRKFGRLLLNCFIIYMYELIYI
jgi:hypothetical protein